MRAFLAALLLPFLTATLAAQVPPREVATPESEIEDAFLGYMHGLIYSDLELDIDGDTLREEFPEFNTNRYTPFDEITSMSRFQKPGGAELTISFRAPMEHTVEAVNIFGWRPVRLLGPDRVVGRELRLDSPEGAFLRPHVADPVLQDLVVLELVDSYLEVDIADFIDFILGPLVDDITVVLAAVVRFESTWYGVLGGVNDRGKTKAGIVDLSDNKFLLRPPRPIAELAVNLVTALTSR